MAVNASQEYDNNAESELDVLDLGRASYEDVWNLQRKLQKSLIEGVGQPTLILCEHHPVVTYGKSANPESLRASPELLKELGVRAIRVERGGDFTYHGPGQLVGYPIIDLRTKKRDVGWYMRSLEEIIIRTLQDFDIIGNRIPGKTGVWTAWGENGTEKSAKNQLDTDQKACKIAAIGVRLSRWCTMHGFSLNVQDCRDGFSLIHPCGFRDIQISSMEQENGFRSSEKVKEILVEHFCDVFEYRR